MRPLRSVALLVVALVALARVAAAQQPAPVPRVDSVRVDTLRPAVPDSVRRVVMPRPPTDTGRRPGPLGAGADLGLDLHTRLESRVDRRTDERCTAGLYLGSLASCQSAFTPDFNFQFALRSAGSVAERLHVNVDYDTQREFDASNVVNIFYQGRPSDRLSRLEVGNVAFVLPSTRFLASGVPSGNYGLQALGRLGPLRWQAIAATQKGNVVRDRTFLIGDVVRQDGEREIADHQVEPRRFFFTIDPALLRGYPNIDILDRAALARAASELPDTLRPRRVVLYRVQFGTQPQNPNGPRFRLLEDPARGAQTYDVLREGVDYYLDESQLWFALVRPLGVTNERLVVAYTLQVNGRDTVIATAGGTPELEFAGREQFAHLVSDPNVLPGTLAFRREIRSVYRIAGDELVRSTTRLRVVSGAGEQEKPATGTVATFLQMFGLAQRTNPASFDLENRLWPRPTDPNYSAAAGGTAGLASVASVSAVATGGTSSAGRIIRDNFVVFPSLRPFARGDSGLVLLGNPTNEAIYTVPSEDLYSPRHPASVYRLKVRYQSEGQGEAGALLLGSVQVRRGSERVVMDGVPLRRDVDYRVDYDIGRLTFARPDTLFTRQRAVTVRFEENPLFTVAPTTLFGLTSTLPLPNGEVNVMAVQQSQSTNFTRPQLGFEPTSAWLAGVNGQLGWSLGPLTRALAALPFVHSTAPSRLSIQGEIATSRPRADGSGEAYVESFEGEAGLRVALTDQQWALSSQPADGRTLPRRYGPDPFDLRRAAALAFQSNGTNAAGVPVTVRSDSIDQNATLVGLGSSAVEPLLWLTLYPLAIGGRYDPATRSYGWTVSGTPGGRRFRSVRTTLSPAGVDLSRTENLEFWTLVDTSAAGRARNPTLVFDLGEISENAIAFAPDTLLIRRGAAPDSLFRGRRLQGLDVLDSERDSISRAFNADANDTGLPGDLIDTLIVVDDGRTSRALRVPLCTGQLRALPRLGDTRANCTVRNNRLDEEDIDLDNALNLTSATRARERLLRFVVDLGDPRRWTRLGKRFTPPLDAPGPGRTLQWVQVRIPFRAADDTLNDPVLRRVRALRVTVVSGAGARDDEFTQLPLARLRLTGAPWIKRDEQTLAGIAGRSPAGGYTLTSLIGTSDRGNPGGDDYQSPPGVTDAAESRGAQFSVGSLQINERSLRLQAGNLPVYARAEAYYRFPSGQQSFMGYQELRLWARGRRAGWGERGELQMYVKIGRDENNFYLYRTPVNSGPGAAAWLPEVRVDFTRFFQLRQTLQNAYLRGRGDTLSCSGVDSALVVGSAVPALAGQKRYVACDGGYMVYTVEPGAAPPNLAAVQELAVGMIRVPPPGSAPSVIGPADSLELWVDDIRLGRLVNRPGYAGQVSVALSAGDLADVRVGFTRRDPYFRQLADQPSFVDDRVVDIVSTLHLEKLLPVQGFAAPLTITHVSASSSPLFLSGTDIPGAGVPALRTPGTGVTTYALTVRRTAPVANPLLGALLDNLGLTSTYTSGDSRSEYQSGSSRNLALSLDYSVSAEPRTTRLPDILAHPLGVSGTRQGADTSTTPVLFRWNPTVLRVSSGLVRGADRRASFLKPGLAPEDSGRIAAAEQNLWRTTSTLEFRPTGALTARWDLVSLRDLRDYGDSTPLSRLATESRARLLGTSIGMERERSMLASIGFAPRLAAWLRPRIDFGTQYGMLRDPNGGSFTPLTFGNTVTTSLPRRLTLSQNLGGGVTIDIARALANRGGATTLPRRLASVLAPIDVTVNRSVLSAFDRAPEGAPLALQFGLAGPGAFRRIGDELAASTGLTQALAASQTLSLPGGMAVVNRYRRTATRSWTRRVENVQAAADGAQTVFPDVSVRWTWKPPDLLLPLITSVGANGGVTRSLARVFLPSDLGLRGTELRGSRVLTVPLNASVAWGFGRGLTTSAGYTRVVRSDSLPGSLAAGRSDEMSVDVGRAFRLPRSLGIALDNDIRARMGYQQTRTSTVITDLARDARSRLADNGRSTFSVNADTDLSETVLFTLQGSRVATYDNNFNRRVTQLVLSTVFQIQFFGDAR